MMRNGRGIHPGVEVAVKRVEYHYPEDSDRHEPPEPGHGVVYPRGRPGIFDLDRVHDGRREGRNAEREAEPDERYAGEYRPEEAPVPIEERERQVARSGYDRARRERDPCPVFIREPTGPARDDEYNQDYRQERRPGLGRRVSVDLDERERQEEEHASERAVHEERRHVCPGEGCGAE